MSRLMRQSAVTTTVLEDQGFVMRPGERIRG